MDVRRLCLNIEKKEHDKIKIFCIETGYTMTGFILEAMKEKMDREKRSKKNET